MTRQLWLLGAKNALIMTTFMVALGLSLAAIISVLSRWGFVASLKFSLLAMYALTLAVFFINLVKNRRKAGSVLLDAGKHHMHRLFLLTAGLLLFSGVLNLFDLATPDADGFTLFMVLFYLSGAAFNLCFAFGRLQIREAGVWTYLDLVRWEKIGSYRWTGESTLVFKTKGLLSFFQGGVRVPPEHKAAFEDHLVRHTQ